MPAVQTAAATYGVRALKVVDTRRSGAPAADGCSRLGRRQRGDHGAQASSRLPANQPASSSSPEW